MQPQIQSLILEKFPKSATLLDLVKDLQVPFSTSENDTILPVATDAEASLVVARELVKLPPLPPVRSLFRGERACLEFGASPPEEYVPLFLCIERVAAGWCGLAKQPVYDVEFERLYTQLRRRPDGRDASLLFGYLRRAAQIVLVLRPTSEAEFEQVCRRLARSARMFHTHPTSVNYWQKALYPLVGEADHLINE